ncbi:MAG: hypothetical protein JKY57_03970 [Kordiimonadaceae bacterium]|nr:hypothetical protein [Kordiimonadaceae bacterium]
MTVAHIFILIAFICLGSAGLAAMQEGLSLVWKQYRKISGQPKPAAKTVSTSSTTTMKISFR